MVEIVIKIENMINEDKWKISKNQKGWFNKKYLINALYILCISRGGGVVDPPLSKWLWRVLDWKYSILWGSPQPYAYFLQIKTEGEKERGRRELIRAGWAPLFTQRCVGLQRPTTGGVLR